MSSPEPKRLVIHHDDIGANHATNTAFVELCDLGICTSGSVMVPCPWFDETAAIARERPDLDLGVHLTLNAEFPKYRWRPLTGVSDNGLTDADGFMWRDVKSVRRAAQPAAVEAELRAQIDTALAAGIDVTHLDPHMGAAMTPEFLGIFLKLGEDYRLPVLLADDISPIAWGENVRPETIPAYDAAVARGNPLFATYLSSPFHDTGDLSTEAVYRGIFGQAKPGLNWGAFHFNPPGEIEHYSPDARMRIDEYELFRSARAKDLIEEAGLELTGMRGFRDAMRG
jgi:chitin disaccharide deacetylase